MKPHQTSSEPAPDPGIKSVYSYLMYGASLPERALRSSGAMIGGVLRESTELLVPQAFRSSRSYTIFVTQMLNFVVEDIGRVQSTSHPDDPEAAKVEGFVARKAVGNFIELAGITTLHLSPLTVLAIVSDIAYGSQSYLKELSVELKREGIIDQNSTIDSAADLLDAVSNASGTTAKAFDTPPLSVQGLQETIEQTREALGKVDPSTVVPLGELDRMWSEMHALAKKQEVSLFEVSSAMTMFTIDKIGNVGSGALSSVRVAGNLFDRHIIDHYRHGMEDIREKGFYRSVAENSRPYVDAVWKNFSLEHSTLTEDLLSGKLVGQMWQGFHGWLGGNVETVAPETAAPETTEPGMPPRSDEATGR